MACSLSAVIAVKVQALKGGGVEVCMMACSLSAAIAVKVEG